MNNHEMIKNFGLTRKFLMKSAQNEPHEKVALLESEF